MSVAGLLHDALVCALLTANPWVQQYELFARVTLLSGVRCCCCCGVAEFGFWFCICDVIFLSCCCICCMVVVMLLTVVRSCSVADCSEWREAVVSSRRVPMALVLYPASLAVAAVC